MSILLRKKSSRPSSRRAPAHLENLETRVLLSGLPPAALAGDIMLTFQTANNNGGNSGPNANAFHFTSSSAVTVIDEISGSSPTNATYNYTVNNATTATLLGFAPDGTHTLTMTFATANSGTVHQVDPGNKVKDAAFVLYAPPIAFAPPASATTNNVNFTVDAGGGNFPSPGSMLWIPGPANTYSLLGLSGNITNNSTGTYSYSPITDSITGLANSVWNDNSSNSGTMLLAYTSSTGGIFYNFGNQNSPNSNDFQEGSFTLSPATTPTHLGYSTPPSSAASCRRRSDR